jgi:glycosyltransferase involved in cell wall biosynthesis
MSKLLMVGIGPLFEKGVRNFGAQCLRTWFFAEPLIRDGHDIRLFTLPIPDPSNPDAGEAKLTERVCEGFTHHAFSNMDMDFIRWKLTEAAKEFQPDAFFGINIVPAWVCAQLPLRVPLWADLNGYEMAEKQGLAAHTGETACLLDAWRREASVARRADKLSTVSRPQLQALLGEMALVGRLNQYTFHYHFAHHIPEAWHAAFAAVRRDTTCEPVLRGKRLPSDAFILLWSGGYNYWTDPEFLFAFLEKTLEANPRVHYVSTGGAIAGYNSQTYERFVALVEKSPRKDRYHLLGWIDAAELPGIYAEADLGLNIDSPNYETLFGARNRVNNMMVAGLPVLTTLGSEISGMIAEAQCGIVCPPNDVDALARQALEMAGEPERLRELGKRARDFALEAFEPGRLTESARHWARQPALAPDNAEKLRRFPQAESFRHTPLNYVEEIAAVAEDCDLLEARKAQIKMERLRARGWYKALKFAKTCVKGCLRPFGSAKK